MGGNTFKTMDAGYLFDEILLDLEIESE